MQKAKKQKTQHPTPSAKVVSKNDDTDVMDEDVAEPVMNKKCKNNSS